jgi:hypothetical protein
MAVARIEVEGDRIDRLIAENHATCTPDDVAGPPPRATFEEPHDNIG